jgi:hypothetical protein
VLASHAYAGAVIAATRNEKVKALVYVATLAPNEGETVTVSHAVASRPVASLLSPPRGEPWRAQR